LGALRASQGGLEIEHRLQHRCLAEQRGHIGGGQEGLEDLFSHSFQAVGGGVGATLAADADAAAAAASAAIRTALRSTRWRTLISDIRCACISISMPLRCSSRTVALDSATSLGSSITRKPSTLIFSPLGKVASACI